MKSLVLALAASALATSPLANAAEDRTDIEVQITIDFDSLSSVDQARDAYRDLLIQARQACLVPQGLKTLGNALDRQCVTEVVEATLKAVNAPLLDLAHAENSPEQLASLDR